MQAHVTDSVQSFDTNVPSRDLVRLLKTQPDLVIKDSGSLPESLLWRTWCELRRRGESNVDDVFVASMRRLHRRRTMVGTDLPVEDRDFDEYKLIDDPLIGELWRAYKKCICKGRTGPAAQLLKDIEAQIGARN